MQIPAHVFISTRLQTVTERASQQTLMRALNQNGSYKIEKNSDEKWLAILSGESILTHNYFNAAPRRKFNRKSGAD